MDVQADQTGVHPEHSTIVFERPETDRGEPPSTDPRGISYADTDQIPAVSRSARPRRRGRASHGLRVIVVLVLILVLLGAALLGLVKSGVIDLSSTSTPPKATVTTTVPSVPADKPLLTQTDSNATSATYTIPITAYAVTVTTTTGRSWVSISPTGQKPVFQAVMNPGQSQHEIILGPSTIEVGAGGTTVTVTSGKHSQVLKPPAAPFNYQINPTR